MNVIIKLIAIFKIWHIIVLKCVQIQKETSTNMYTPFLIGLN